MKSIVCAILLLVTCSSMAQDIQTTSPLSGSGNPDTSGSASKLYHLPFCSRGNTLELEIENASGVPASNVTVSAANLPKWIHLDYLPKTSGMIKPHGTATVQFGFSVDENAPVTTAQEILISIRAAGSQQWSKRIGISVEPPTRFELRQNYPNPFNPSTTITYLLPQDSRVTCTIYSVLGQEVRRMVDNIQPAGLGSFDFRAEGLPSGVYFYRLSAIPLPGPPSSSSAGFSAVRRMLLTK